MLLIKNISKRTILFAVAILLAAAFLCGCVPKNYSKSQEDALVEECMPAIQEFLADRYGDYQMGEFHLLKGQIEPDKPLYGRYGSNVVKGSYTVNGNTWDLVYDKETGKFYTNELLLKLMQQETDRIREYLVKELPNEDLTTFKISVLDIYYMVKSHDVRINNHGETADTYVYISSVLPAEITEESLPVFAARNFDGGIVSRIRCHYSSAKKDGITESNFQAFFADNPAYQVKQYLFLDNDNPSAV